MGKKEMRALIASDQRAVDKLLAHGRNYGMGAVTGRWPSSMTDAVTNADLARAWAEMRPYDWLPEIDRLAATLPTKQLRDTFRHRAGRILPAVRRGEHEEIAKATMAVWTLCQRMNQAHEHKQSFARFAKHYHATHGRYPRK